MADFQNARCQRDFIRHVQRVYYRDCAVVSLWDFDICLADCDYQYDHAFVGWGDIGYAGLVKRKVINKSLGEKLNANFV